MDCGATLFHGTWRGDVSHLTPFQGVALEVELRHGAVNQCTLAGSAEVFGAPHPRVFPVIGAQDAAKASNSSDRPSARLELWNEFTARATLDRTAAEATGGGGPAGPPALEVDFFNVQGELFGSTTLEQQP